MEITRPRTCNGNYTPWDLCCTPWESCGEGVYRNLLFYCRGVLTVLKSIHPRRGKKNDDDHDYDEEEDVYSKIYKDPSSTKPSDPPPTTLNAFADLQNDDHYCVVRVMIVITTETKLDGNRK